MRSINNDFPKTFCEYYEKMMLDLIIYSQAAMLIKDNELKVVNPRDLFIIQNNIGSPIDNFMGIPIDTSKQQPQHSALPPEAPKINLIPDDAFVTLPIGTTMDEKKLTREGTWMDLFYPRSGFTTYKDDGKKNSPLKGNESFVFTKDKCAHTWQNYIGFTDSYDFCTKCDEKRRTK